MVLVKRDKIDQRNRIGNLETEHMYMETRFLTKICSSLLLGECQLKPQWDTTTELLKRQNYSLIITSFSEKLELQYIKVNVKWCKHFEKQLGCFKKWKTGTIATPLPPMHYPQEMEAYVHQKICTWMFRVALFVIAPNWKQFICPSTGK